MVFSCVVHFVQDRVQSLDNLSHSYTWTVAKYQTEVSNMQSKSKQSKEVCANFRSNRCTRCRWATGGRTKKKWDTAFVMLTWNNSVFMRRCIEELSKVPTYHYFFLLIIAWYIAQMIVAVIKRYKFCWSIFNDVTKLEWKPTLLSLPSETMWFVTTEQVTALTWLLVDRFWFALHFPWVKKANKGGTY